MEFIEIDGIIIKYYPDINKIYSIYEKIGEGSYSETFLASRKSKLLTLKILNSNNFNMNQFMNEIDNLFLSRNIRGVVKYIDHFCYGNKNDLKFVIVMDYIEGPTFQSFVDKYLSSDDTLTNDAILNIAILLLKPIIRLNNKSILHRDVKPGNIIIDIRNKILSYIDLGTSCNIEKICKFGGSLTYIPPEIFVKSNLDNVESDTWDSYSIGVILYLLKFKSLPFFGLDYNHKNTFSLVENDVVTTLINRTLDPNPQQRYRPRDMLQFIHHNNVVTRLDLSELLDRYSIYYDIEIYNDSEKTYVYDEERTIILV